MAQPIQYAPNHSNFPLNQQSQHEAGPSTYPVQAMDQTPQHAQNYSIPLSIPAFNYPLPNSSNGVAGQSTRPTGRPRNHDAHPSSPRNWSGRRTG